MTNKADDPPFRATFWLSTGAEIVADIHIDAAIAAVKAVTRPGPGLRYNTSIIPIIEEDRSALLEVTADVWGEWVHDPEKSRIRITEEKTGRVWVVAPRDVIAIGFEDPSKAPKGPAGFSIDRYRKEPKARARDRLN